MRSICAYPGCKSKSMPVLRDEKGNIIPEKRISFFKYPTDPERRKQWDELLKRTKPLVKHAMVCELHFAPEHILNHFVVPLTGGRTFVMPRQRSRLAKDAIPYSYDETYTDKGKNCQNEGGKDLLMDNLTLEASKNAQCQNTNNNIPKTLTQMEQETMQYQNKDEERTSASEQLHSQNTDRDPLETSTQMEQEALQYEDRNRESINEERSSQDTNEEMVVQMEEEILQCPGENGEKMDESIEQCSDEYTDEEALDMGEPMEEQASQSHNDDLLKDHITMRLPPQWAIMTDKKRAVIGIVKKNGSPVEQIMINQDSTFTVEFNEQEIGAHNLTLYSGKKSFLSLEAFEKAFLGNGKNDRIQRTIKCHGFFYSDSTVKKPFKRRVCGMCHDLTKVKKKYEQVQSVLREKVRQRREKMKLLNRRNKRLASRIEEMKKELKELRVRCSATNERILREKIEQLPAEQQEYVKACFIAAAHPNKSAQYPRP